MMNTLCVVCTRFVSTFELMFFEPRVLRSLSHHPLIWDRIHLRGIISLSQFSVLVLRSRIRDRISFCVWGFELDQNHKLRLRSGCVTELRHRGDQRVLTQEGDS